LSLIFFRHSWIARRRGRTNGEQIELFGNVLDRLIKTIELRAIAGVSTRIALAEISSQLAPIAQAPPSAVRRLASNDEIAVAGPILKESARLSSEDLIEIANTKSKQHLLAISGRWWLKEIVTDVILARQYPAVSRRIVTNPGARVSAEGFAIILAQAESDPDLAVETGIRVDLPSGLRQKLLSKATEAVRTRLLSRAPPDLFEEIRSAVAAVSASATREMSKGRDFTAAKRFVAVLSDSGELTEAILFGFAKTRQYEETVAALTVLCRSTIEVIRPLMQSLRDDGILIPCKAAGLSWETVHGVLDCRFANGLTGPRELRPKINMPRQRWKTHADCLDFGKCDLRLFRLSLHSLASWCVDALTVSNIPRRSWPRRPGCSRDRGAQGPIGSWLVKQPTN
jgi:uncharacterized protein (DUF2336 family)